MPHVDLPPRYVDVLAALPSHEVSFGAGGLKLFEPDELPAAQVGYSIDPEGRPLLGWKHGWLVIGIDTGMGDPLILDTADSGLPVYSSWHGEGVWEPHLVATSMESFAACFLELAAISQGRSNPVEVNKNPLSDSEKATYLARTADANGSKIEIEFWHALLAYAD